MPHPYKDLLCLSYTGVEVESAIEDSTQSLLYDVSTIVAPEFVWFIGGNSSGASSTPDSLSTIDPEGTI